MRALAVFALTAVMATSAHADDELVRAHQLEASLEYDQALAIVDRILARGGADPSRLVELHLFAGKLAGGLDRAELARNHFARVLAIRPDTTLPEGTSPKLTDPFAAAKARTTPLVIHISSSQGFVTLTATDPLGLIAGISVRVVDGAGQPRDLVERSALRLAIPLGTKATEVTALDANANRIWVGTPPAEPIAIERPVIRIERARYARWSTWAAVTGVAIIAGSVSAWRFDSAQRKWDRLSAEGKTDFSELEALEERGRRWGIATNISFGIAAASGIVTAVFWLRGRDEPRLTVTPGPGAGVGVSGRF